MKKKILNIILIFTIIFNFSWVFAEQIKWTKINIKEIKTEEISIEEIFNFFAKYYIWKIPESYNYIKLNYKDIEIWSDLERSLKILIYLDLIKNPNLSLNPDYNLNAWSFYKLAEKILWVQVNFNETKNELINRNTFDYDLNSISNFLSDKNINIDTKTKNVIIKQKLEILNNVYKTLINWHYDKDNLNEEEMIDSAISWIAEWTNDRHTVYFPPIESKNFQDTLSWDYEWIWSYVDMEQPWSVKIVSPIPWSPSEKSWIKWWDLIIKVDWKDITEKNSLEEVISWIKWPAWTSVLLTIDRNSEIIEIEVIRERIIIHDIETKIIDWNTYYLQIKNFWEHVSEDFKNALLDIKENNWIKKIIIDVRNNWWWYLSEVVDILSYFIEEWKKTAIVKYNDIEKFYTSNWYNILDINDYKIVILQNSWTASASEILVWTLKDYYPEITLIWENTHWKWSVQIIKNYIDGSILKYTIAKWFTWLTEKWIDWIWIKPDIELELDLDSYTENWTDNQLNKALEIN